MSNTTRALAMLTALVGTACKGAPPMAPGAGADKHEAAAEVVATSPERLAQRLQECWKLWSAAAWDDVQACYSVDATHEIPGSDQAAARGDEAIIARMKSQRALSRDEQASPQLVMVNGTKIVAITLLAGTRSGQKFGVLMGQLLRTDDDGRIINQWDFLDDATIVGQLRPDIERPVRPVLERAPAPTAVEIASLDDPEPQENLATVKKAIHAFNAHDAVALGEAVADGVAWADMAKAKDLAKSELTAAAQEGWQGFSDMKLVVAESWAAGNHVAVVAILRGTNDGTLSWMNLGETGSTMAVPCLAVFRLEGGKIVAASVFYQSLAFSSQMTRDSPPP